MNSPTSRTGTSGESATFTHAKYVPAANSTDAPDPVNPTVGVTATATPDTHPSACHVPAVNDDGTAPGAANANDTVSPVGSDGAVIFVWNFSNDAADMRTVTTHP